jgi:small subunit ribosomal protein S2
VPTPTVSMKDLLTSGVHFGHQTRRWNPKMKSYIFSERGGIYIIDLQKTTVLIDEAYAFLRNVTGRGGKVLFVGTKKQTQEVIKEEAERVGMPYVNSRWLGGLLTNYVTLSKRIKRLHELRQLIADGSLDLLPTREQIKMKGELLKLETNLGGVADMERVPDAVFVVDPRKEQIVIKEANKLKIPVVALVDTNCDPDEIQYVIPGNDDAIRSCGLIVRTIARACEEGRAKVAMEEFKAAQRAAAEKAAAEKAAAEAAAAAAAAEKEAARLAAEEAAKAPAPEAAPAAAGAQTKPTAKGETVAAPKVEAKPPAKPAAKVATKEYEKPAAKAEAKPAAKPAAKAEVKVEAKPAAKAEAKADEKPVAKAEAKVEAKPAAKTEPKADEKAAAKPEAKADEKPAKTEAKAEAKPAAKKPAAAKADEKPAAKAETKTDDAKKDA